jgi:hypothetical protein
MSDLVAFYAARLDEDEATAKAAADPDPVWTQPDPERYPGKIEDSVGVVVYDEGCPTSDQAAHIARHDPARVLREVEAKRAILANYDAAFERRRQHPGDVASAADLLAMVRIVKLLVAVYSDHPDYDPGWRP